MNKWVVTGVYIGLAIYPGYRSMDWSTFESSLTGAAPPAALPHALQALWYDANGDWDEAHRVAQLDEGRDGAWVHAYLHRKEGDLANAAYWYRRAGQPTAHHGLDAEWKEIAEALLGATTAR